MRASIDLRSDADELIRLQAFAETFASDCGLADDERARLLVILEELFTNVVAHNFVDDGPPFDPLAHSEPDFEASPEQRPVGGLGIAIVRALAHRANYRREGHRNHLYLIRRLAPATKNVTPPR